MIIVFQVLFVLHVSAGVWSVKIYGVVGPLPRKHSFITPWVHTHDLLSLCTCEFPGKILDKHYFAYGYKN